MSDLLEWAEKAGLEDKRDYRKVNTSPKHRDLEALLPQVLNFLVTGTPSRSPAYW